MNQLLICLHGPTAIAYSNDPIAPARVAVEFEKKLKILKLLADHLKVKN